MTFIDVYTKAKHKNLPLRISVYVFDDGQPLKNPKPYWLLVAKFNERECAEIYIRANMRRFRRIKAMKMITPDNIHTQFYRKKKHD